MTTQEIFRSIASEVQLVKDVATKEKFLFVLGALIARVISLKKVSEIMRSRPELLELMGLEFSYFSQQDIALEKNGVFVKIVFNSSPLIFLGLDPDGEKNVAYPTEKGFTYVS